MKYYYFITFFLFSIISQAQIVNIPDAIFKNALVNTNCVDTNGNGIADSNADTNDDGEIQESEAEAVLWLDVSWIDIVSLEGIQSFINLVHLECNGNELTSLDVTQNINLVYLSCNHNQLTNLDVTQNVTLEWLSLGVNQVTSIDVTQNLNLERLVCESNLLTSIDVSQNIILKFLGVAINQLTSIDVSQNQDLERFHIGQNLLNSLDVTQNLNLEALSCYNNLLTSLSVTQNTNLNLLSFGNNQIANIDLTQNLILEKLWCQTNELTSLDLSQNQDLETLHCYDNQLITSLNIKNGNNHNITNMWAQINPNLYCIQVDDVDYANSNPSGWNKDDWAEYSEECILSTQDFNQLSFTLYPNPIQNLLNVESQEPFDFVRIYSIEGVLVKETTNTTINVSDLPSGLYFAQISIEGKKFTKKFIKS